MVRKIVDRVETAGGAHYTEFACTSLDTKPTAGIITGSLALEVDTGDLYAFDETGAEWNKIAELGGGGGEK